MRSVQSVPDLGAIIRSGTGSPSAPARADAVTAALRDAGWGNYSLFLGDDGLLVGYVETEDFAAAQRAMAETDVNDRWQQEMAGFFGERADEGLVRLEEVFHLG